MLQIELNTQNCHQLMSQLGGINGPDVVGTKPNFVSVLLAFKTWQRDAILQLVQVA